MTDDWKSLYDEITKAQTCNRDKLKNDVRIKLKEEIRKASDLGRLTYTILRPSIIEMEVAQELKPYFRVIIKDWGFNGGPYEDDYASRKIIISWV